MPSGLRLSPRRCLPSLAESRLCGGKFPNLPMTTGKLGNLPPQGPSLAESRLRHGVEARGVLGQVRLPAFRVPQFQVIADADEHHLMSQARELEQAVGYEDP